MYTVDQYDRLVDVNEIPTCRISDPSPMVLGTENALVVAYHVDDAEKPFDGKTVRIADLASGVDRVALTWFGRPLASSFGPPAEEAIAGHALAARGLRPFGSFEVVHSSWIRQLELMNRTHPRHKPEVYAGYRHFILTFRDSMFECVARGYAVEQHDGPMTRLMARAAMGING
jgi:hypothetical protein